MKQQHEVLFTPLQVGTVTLQNRIAICAMEGTEIVAGLIKPEYKGNEEYYINRAKDGYGLIIPGLLPLRSIVGSQWVYKKPAVFKKVRPLMDKMHQYGSKVFLQIGAGWGRSMIFMDPMGKLIDNKFLGTMLKPVINMDKVMIAADNTPNVWNPRYMHRALTKAEIQEFVTAYAETAYLCKQSGVDGVEVHAVHEGYLLDQFTTKYTNHRTDEYGGSFENRYRFAVEVVQAIKAKCGQDFPVSLRFSVTSKTKGFNDGAVPGETFMEAGRDMEEAEHAIKYLEDAGYDMFNCDNGTYDAWWWSHPPVYMPLNCNLAEAKHIKHFTSKPVFCAGRMQPDDAAAAISDGDLDGMGVARQALTDEHFIHKIQAEQFDDIRPCISCHNTCLPAGAYKGQGNQVNMSAMGTQGCCALNPYTHNEKKYAVTKAVTSKRIAVIGGGIAGMEAAIQCAKRGHTVSLYEKSNRLCGVFNEAAAPVFKEKDKELIAWYLREIKKYPIDIQYNQTVQSLDTIKADEYILATGATPRKLKIEGAERAIDAITFLNGETEIGDRVVVVGGGLTGCEIAYELALQGKHPVIVEMLDFLIKSNTVCASNSFLLQALLEYQKVPVYLESKTIKMDDKSVTIETKDGIKTLPADSVIYSIGYTSNKALYDEKNKHVHVIGDANKVSNLMGAIWSANDIAVELSK